MMRRCLDCPGRVMSVNPRILRCVKCREARKREMDRRWQERYRLKKGLSASDSKGKPSDLTAEQLEAIFARQRQARNVTRWVSQRTA